MPFRWVTRLGTMNHVLDPERNGANFRVQKHYTIHYCGVRSNDISATAAADCIAPIVTLTLPL